MDQQTFHRMKTLSNGHAISMLLTSSADLTSAKQPPEAPKEKKWPPFSRRNLVFHSGSQLIILTANGGSRHLKHLRIKLWQQGKRAMVSGRPFLMTAKPSTLVPNIGDMYS
jgi:hypothetical protein